MPFTKITFVYVSLILFIMMPLRVYLNRSGDKEPNYVNRFYAIIVFVHMLLCLSWIIYACVELQYINYYALLLITMGPACTLGLAVILFTLCLPCLLSSLCKTMRDER